MSTSHHTTTPQMPHDPDLDAYLRTKPLRDALEGKGLPRLGINRLYAVAKASQTAENCRFLQPRMAQMEDFDPANYDNLEDLARGLRFADGELARRIESAKELPGFVKDGYPLRRQLLTYAESLSLEGLLAAKIIDLRAVRARR